MCCRKRKQIFNKINESIFHQVVKLQQTDPNDVHFSDINRLIQENMTCYHRIYWEMKAQTVQTILDRVFKKTTTASKDNASDSILVISTDNEDI